GGGEDRMHTRLGLGLTVSGLFLAASGITGCGRTLCDGDLAFYGGGQNAGRAPEPGDQGGAAPADAARALDEADVVQLDGDRLFALSRRGGLAVLDVSSSTGLRLLGRAGLAGVPFEMFLRGDHLFAMTNGAIGHDGARVKPAQPNDAN